MTEQQRAIYESGYSEGRKTHPDPGPSAADCPHRYLTNDWQLWQGGYWTAVRDVDQANEIAFASIN